MCNDSNSSLDLTTSPPTDSRSEHHGGFLSVCTICLSRHLHANFKPIPMIAQIKEIEERTDFLREEHCKLEIHTFPQRWWSCCTSQLSIYKLWACKVWFDGLTLDFNGESAVQTLYGPHHYKCPGSVSSGRHKHFRPRACCTKAFCLQSANKSGSPARTCSQSDVKPQRLQLLLAGACESL